MYNHQLQYDRQLTTFLVDTKTALNDMQGEVWDAICALVENEGITFDACLSLTLQVLNLFLQIPIDISFHKQIPLTIAYCPESSVYRRWRPEQGGVSPLCKEIKVCRTLSKVNQVRVLVVPHLLLLLTIQLYPMGHRAPDVDLIAMHEASLLPAAGDQALRAQQPAIIPFIPMLLKTVRCQAASLIPSRTRETVLKKRTMPRKTRVGSRPQVTGRRYLMVKIGRSTLIPRTRSPVLVSSLVNMRTPTLSHTPERKSSQHSKSGARTALRRTAPRKIPVNHGLLRKSRQWMRHSMMGPGKKHGCWTYALMLGIMTKLPKVSQAGQQGTP